MWRVVGGGVVLCVMMMMCVDTLIHDTPQTHTYHTQHHHTPTPRTLYLSRTQNSKPQKPKADTLFCLCFTITHLFMCVWWSLPRLYIHPPTHHILPLFVCVCNSLSLSSLSQRISIYYVPLYCIIHYPISHPFNHFHYPFIHLYIRMTINNSQPIKNILNICATLISIRLCVPSL